MTVGGGNGGEVEGLTGVLDSALSLPKGAGMTMWGGGVLHPPPFIQQRPIPN